MQAPRPVKKHPNASLSATGGGLGVGLVEILLTVKVGLTALSGALITGFFSSGILLIGRHGIRGIWEWCQWGDGEDDG